jgi:hypothetical protein
VWTHIHLFSKPILAGLNSQSNLSQLFGLGQYQHYTSTNCSSLDDSSGYPERYAAIFDSSFSIFFPLLSWLILRTIRSHLSTVFSISQNLEKQSIEHLKPINPIVPKEIEPLVNSLNTLLSEIAESMQRENVLHQMQHMSYVHLGCNSYACTSFAECTFYRRSKRISAGHHDWN